MPESIRLQVEATREHTLALYEGALQTAKVAETLQALTKIVSEFGAGVVSLPATSSSGS